MSEIPTFVTLGPEGTDHERATKQFIDFQGLTTRADIELVDNFIEGLEVVHGESGSFLVQCSAHPDVDLVTEKYPQETVVLDEFICATRSLALLARAEVEEPKSLALVPATRGYTDLSQWRKDGKTTVDAQSKPVVNDMLLRGECDAGITFAELSDKHPGQFVTLEEYGKVRTTWIVYGDVKRSNYRGRVIARRQPEMFLREV